MSNDELVFQGGAVSPPKPDESLASFSVILPTYGEHEALGKTLRTVVEQSEIGKLCDVEVLVVGDGFEKEVKQMVEQVNGYAALRRSCAKFFYYSIPHTGSGNRARAAGLKQARKDWVVFVDNGEALCFRFFEVLADSLVHAPESKIISWDMVQLLEPIPVTTTVHAIDRLDRSQGLPYVLPGCATAVRRELAQKVEWPDVPASDWAYFTKLWVEMFGPPESADETNIDKWVTVIPWVLCVAYAYRQKVRLPVDSVEEFNERGFNKGWMPPQETTDAGLAETNAGTVQEG